MRPTHRLTTRVVPRAAFDDALIARLFALYQTYYAPTDHGVFAADFRAKTWAIVLSDPAGRDVGFSTIVQHHAVIDGQAVSVLFSGDTIIDRAFWGDQALPYRWIKLAGQIKSAAPEVPLYWLLISKGHRTYRYMPAFTFDYFPRADRATPASMTRLMDVLGQAQFGAAYDKGIVRAGELPTRLRGAFDGMTGQTNRHAQFFAAANPGYAAGDELLCLCELSADNLRPRARAQFEKGVLCAA